MEMEQKPEQELPTTATESELDELFVVEGLESEAAEQNLFQLMAAGAADALSPLDLPDDQEAISELSQSPVLDEEIDLNAQEGEIAAVEAPAVLDAEMFMESAAVEATEGAAPVRPILVFRPWMAAAIAATVVIGVGLTAKLLIPASRTPIDLGTVANTPAPVIAMLPLDAACQPRVAAQTESLASWGNPGVSSPVDWAIANPVPEGEPAPILQNPAPANDTPNVHQPEKANDHIPPVDSAEPPVVNDPNSSPVKAAFGRGSEVFVKLRNGNLFNGRLEKLTNSDAKLRVEKGEIEFPLTDLDLIMPVAQASADKGPEAIVQLQNGNRLAGRLAEDGKTKIKLAVGTSEVTISRAQIQNIEKRPPLGLIFDNPADKAPEQK